MKSLLQHKSVNWGLIFISFLLYYYLGYSLDRSQFPVLITGVLVLFVSSYFIIENKKNTPIQLLAIAMLFRLVLLLVIPNLSQDFYRFVWDGRMLFNNFNPYLTTPKTLIEQGIAPIANSQELFEGMGNLNASHYTNYPPVSQLCYYIAAIFGSKSIMVSVVMLRLQIICADIGVFYFGKKILELLNSPVKSIFFYLLNPFIILELTSNLHFEAVMVVFLLWSIYLLFKNNWIASAITLGLSISVKLIPLIFLPVFFLYFFKKKLHLKELFTKHSIDSIRKYIVFCLIAIGTSVGTFAPFISAELIANFGASIGLWFQKFEFNASIYYIIRWIGFQVVGWNIIGTVGKILPVVVITIVAFLSLKKQNYIKEILLRSMLFSFCSYLLLSTTIHPWYLAIPLSLSIFTNYRFVWVWSFTIFFSYHAYRLPEFKESMLWVTLEYTIVFSVFIFEVIQNKKVLLNK